MNQSIYEKMVKNAPFGYALYSIELSPVGLPISFKLIEHNDTFILHLQDDITTEHLAKFIHASNDDKPYNYKWYDDHTGDWYHVYVYQPDAQHFVLKMVDITSEIKSQEQRNESLLKLMQTKYDSIESLLSAALDESISITESEIGYLYYYDEIKKEFILNNWSSTVMDSCKIMEKQTTYQLDDTGLWGEAVRQRKPILVNDYSATNQYKKGIPYGHTPLKSFLTVPIFDLEDIVAVIGVANKQSPYDQTDIYQLNLLMSNVWAFAKNIKTHQEMHYLSYHDQLTGLYNRYFFEEEIARLNTKRQLPLSVIIGDINGLKLTNDVFGHLEGDKILKAAADIIKTACRNEDIIARWGGDEYIILLPQTPPDKLTIICQRIELAMAANDDLVISPSISLGFATKLNEEDSISGLIKEAEDLMYKQKLTESKSQRSKIIDSMRQSLYEKSHETEAHANRLKKYSMALGRLLGLSKENLFDLELFAYLHDIGKIGIHEGILNKPSALTEEEWDEMRKHPEIGYRIAQSTPDLSQIAEYILTHHERYDATGYPRGLEGNEIPIASRIVAIVDAYDAMTSDRPYRKALSKEAAIWEVKRCSGSQFDPQIVDLFLSLLTMNISQ